MTGCSALIGDFSPCLWTIPEAIPAEISLPPQNVCPHRTSSSLTIRNISSPSDLGTDPRLFPSKVSDTVTRNSPVVSILVCRFYSYPSHPSDAPPIDAVDQASVTLPRRFE
ncbi:hypothetical protein NW759_003394 [Fusarium solani]|nr:hypothetical protein NW759_003394 [Fusarium solani]